MRIPRFRFTVRRMMLAVALLALALFAAQEFGDGSPPRFVLRGIPARVGRLRPGMTWGQTRDILGLERSWLRGGTDARGYTSGGNGHSAYETYCLGPMRMETVDARVGGGPPGPVKIERSPATIHLVFRIDPETAGMGNWRQDGSTRLVRASFASGSGRVVEMPGSR